MQQVKKAFTLIELIIVVVIIGILALIAIPRYFANVAKAQKSQVYANLDAIRQAVLAYYTVYGVYPTSFIWPITVTIDGDTVVNISNPDPNSTSWYYYIDTTPNCTARLSHGVVATKRPGDTCYYALCTNGYAYQTCLP